MNYTKIILLSLLILPIILFPHASLARSESAIRCDTCVTYSNYSTAAQDIFKYRMPGIYNTHIVNTVTYDVWKVTIEVVVADVFGDEFPVNIISLQRETQKVRDDYEVASELAKGFVVDISNQTLPGEDCETASGNCLGLSTYLRGLTIINTYSTGNLGTKLREQFFGKEDIIVTVIYADGSTKQFELVFVMGAEIAFSEIPGTTTVPSGVGVGGAPLFGYDSSEPGGTQLIGGVYNASCDWWKFVYTYQGQVIGVSYQCL